MYTYCLVNCDCQRAEWVFKIILFALVESLNPKNIAINVSLGTDNWRVNMIKRKKLKTNEHNINNYYIRCIYIYITIINLIEHLHLNFT